MNELEKYTYVQVKGLKKNQPTCIIFNPKFVIEKKIDEIDKLKNRFVFFVITEWLSKQNDYDTTKFYGRITDISPKAFQINFSVWFPKSQLIKIFLKTTQIQYRLINFMETKK